MKTLPGILAIFVLVLVSCKEEPKPKPQYTKEQLTDLSIDMNSWDADRQQDEIDQYIAHHGWKMEQTKSGIYYMTMESGNGDSAKTNKTARVTYDIYLLDGKKCYSSGDTIKEFVIGEDYVESGLHEGILLMRVGDKKRFILPSYLAHGLTGDEDKIGPRQSVMYEIKLVGLR